MKTTIMFLLALGTEAFSPSNAPNHRSTAIQSVASEFATAATMAGSAATVYYRMRDMTNGDPAKTTSTVTTSAPSTPVSSDVSVPYDAAAMLAYDVSDKSMPFSEFKIKYEAETVAMIKAKQVK